MMRVEVTTRGGKRVPWPVDEAPPTRLDSVRWGGELWEVVDVRWDVDTRICHVTLSAATTLYDADARSK